MGRGRLLLTRLAVGSGIVFLAVSVGGGYGLHWNWTGFQDNNTVWDWLNLFLLPIALGLIPFAPHLSRRRLATILGIALAALAVLMVGGYGFHWRFTGFAGNTLWDWLRLLLVPVAVPFAANAIGQWETRREAPPPPPQWVEEGASAAGPVERPGHPSARSSG